MAECQVCAVSKGRHKVEVQGICGKHAEEIKKILEWWAKQKKK